MRLEVLPMPVTVDASGDGSYTSPRAIVGLLYAVEWVDGDFADGVDATFTVTRTPSGVDATLLTLTDANNDAKYYPRTPFHSAAGAALTATSGGDNGMMLIYGYPKVVVAQGGEEKAGAAYLYYYPQE